MKIFITASSGVGKSAVIEELAKRGYTALDADDRQLKLTRLQVKATGEVVDWPKGYIDWSKYTWNADKYRLEELLASDKTVFLCGLLGNQEELYHYFDKLIALTIEPKEHERRLRTRPKREVGDDEKNIVRRLERYSMHMQKFIESGFVRIDNSGTVNQTVDEILRVVHEH